MLFGKAIMLLVKCYDIKKVKSLKDLITNQWLGPGWRTHKKERKKELFIHKVKELSRHWFKIQCNEFSAVKEHLTWWAIKQSILKMALESGASAGMPVQTDLSVIKKRFVSPHGYNWKPQKTIESLAASLWH